MPIQPFPPTNVHNCIKNFWTFKTACKHACICWLSQGEVLVPLQLLVSTAFARLFGFAAQPVRGHLHEGAEARVTARQLG